MRRLASRGLIPLAIVFIALGVIIRSSLVEWALDIIGLLFIAAGVVAGTIAVLGRSRRSGRLRRTCGSDDAPERPRWGPREGRG